MTPNFGSQRLGRLDRALLIIIAVACAAWLAFALSWQQVKLAIEPPSIRQESGKAFVAPVVPPLRSGYELRSDASGSISSLKLTENDVAVGPRAALHDEIRSLGGGRFSHWQNEIHFSTTDGSDPRSNQKTYRAIGKAQPTFTAKAIAALPLVAFCIAFAFRRRDIARGWIAEVQRRIHPPISQREAREIIRVGRDVGHVTELDGIRGYACVSVLFAHCVIGLLNVPEGSVLWNVKYYSLSILLGGVDLFFVLSGFLIGGILMDSRHKPHFFKRFWVRRAGRILPVLWVLLISYAIALWVERHFNLPWLNIWVLAEPRPPFWSYATFTQSFWLAANGFGGPGWVGITWSLAIEEQFYVFFPLLVFILSRRSLVLTALAGLAVTPLLRDVFERLYGQWYAPYVLLPSRLDGLMIGVLVAAIIRQPRVFAAFYRARYFLDALALWLAWAIATSHPLLSLWPSPLASPFPPLKQTALALMFAILIFRIFGRRQDWLNRLWRTDFLIKAGAISYALYMYHQAVNGTLHGWLFGQAPQVASLEEAALGLSVMVIAALLSWASFVWLEKPIRRASHVYARRYDSPQLPTTAAPFTEELRGEPDQERNRSSPAARRSIPA